MRGGACAASLVAVAIGLAVSTAAGQSCTGGRLFYQHDGSFEGFTGWLYYPGVDPAYGAIGEGYDLGPGQTQAAVYWVSATGGFGGDFDADVFLWEGGVSRPPGAILAFVPLVHFEDVAFWPEVSIRECSLNIEVSGEFTVGLRAQEIPNDYALCPQDTTGPGGHPWVCEYPDGWRDASISYPVRSVGMGVCFSPQSVVGVGEEPQAPGTSSTTWGRVKALRWPER